MLLGIYGVQVLGWVEFRSGVEAGLRLLVTRTDEIYLLLTSRQVTLHSGVFRCVAFRFSLRLIRLDRVAGWWSFLFTVCKDWGWDGVLLDGWMD